MFHQVAKKTVKTPATKQAKQTNKTSNGKCKQQLPKPRKNIAIELYRLPNTRSQLSIIC